MKIEETIEKIKSYCKGIDEQGNPVTDNKDRILYDGGIHEECTGIVTCSYASVQALNYAAETGSNLVISHEGIFWSHGDPVDWLTDNETYLQKKKILDQHHITVWRCFDHMASGIPINKGWVDASFYGLVKELGWEDMLDYESLERECKGFYLSFTLKKPRTMREIASEIIQKASLNGVPVVGNPDTLVHHIYLSRHQIIGGPDTHVIEDVDKGDYECVIVGEMTDYTLCEYVRDAVSSGRHKTIIKLGNFNEVELGMHYCEEWIPSAVGTNIPVHYVSSGDSVSEYILKK